MIRANAIALLGGYPDASTVALLRKTIIDPDPLIRYATMTVVEFAEPEFITGPGRTPAEG